MYILLTLGYCYIVIYIIVHNISISLFITSHNLRPIKSYYDPKKKKTNQEHLFCKHDLNSRKMKINNFSIRTFERPN